MDQRPTIRDLVLRNIKADIARQLQSRADINAQGGRYGNSLQAAAYKGKREHIRLLLDQGADVNSQGGMFGTVLQAAAYNGNIEVIRLLLDKGATLDFKSGKYGAALEKMLALQPAGPGQKVPGDAPLLVELIQDHAPFLIRHLPESESEGIASWYLRNGDRCSLDVFTELLESYGWKREAQGDSAEESRRLETERELYKSESEGKNNDVTEDAIELEIKPETEEKTVGEIEGEGRGSGSGDGVEGKIEL